MIVFQKQFTWQHMSVLSTKEIVATAIIIIIKIGCHKLILLALYF